MSLIEALLVASAVAYFWGIILPEASTNFGLEHRRLERLCFLAFGVGLLVAVYPSGFDWLRRPYLLVLGIVYVGAALCSYIGYVRWKPVWIDRDTFMAGAVSVPVQMVMFMWDMAISVGVFLLWLG